MVIFGLKAKFLGLGIVRSEFVALNALAFEGKETTTVYNNDRLTAFDPGQPG